MIGRGVPPMSPPPAFRDGELSVVNRLRFTLTFGVLLAAVFFVFTVPSAQTANKERAAQARLLLRQAAEVALGVEEGEEQAAVLAHIAAAQWRAGELETAAGNFRRALRVLDGAVGANLQPDLREFRRAQIAGLRAEVGDFAGARETLSKVEDDNARPQGLLTIAIAEARAGKTEDALQTMRELQDAESRDEILEMIVVFQVRAGNLSAALKTAQAIETPQYRSSALAWLAAGEARAGHRAEANARLQEAFGLARQVEANGQPRGRGFYKNCWSDEPEPVPDQMYEGIATAQAMAGDVVGALDTLQRIQSQARQENLLVNVSNVQAHTGDLLGARATAERIEREPCRAVALSGIAQVQLRRGDGVGATLTAKEITAPDEAARVLVGIAGLHVEKGDAVAAKHSLELAAERVEGIREVSSRAQLLAQIARLHAKLGLRAEAAKVFEQGFASARAAQKEAKQTGDDGWAFKQMAVEQAAAGFEQEALATVELLDQRLRPQAFQEIGRACAGDTSGALARLGVHRPPLERAYLLLGAAEGILAASERDAGE